MLILHQYFIGETIDFQYLTQRRKERRKNTSYFSKTRIAPHYLIRLKT